MDKRGLKGLENRVLRGIYRLEREEVSRLEIIS
jgi:hypothetical protein